MNRQRDGIVTTGEGSAAATVDTVVLTLNLVDTRPTAGAAFQAIGHTATRVLAVLADDGVDARSVRTADLTLGPRTAWREEREVVLDYAATQRLLVRLPGLSGFERLLEDVALTGGDSLRIESIQLSPSEPMQAQREARDRAMADARLKAEHLAALAGRSLGPVRSIHDGNVGGGGPVSVGFSLARAAAVPVATGDSSVTAVVTVRWSFAD